MPEPIIPSSQPATPNPDQPETPAPEVPNPEIFPQGSEASVVSEAGVKPETPETPEISEVQEVQEVSGDETSNIDRQQPIPPPSEPKQYRAIGLVRGQYMPSQEQLTRGTLLAADGTLIDAVLLGRVMSLVKNHLDIDQQHLWVVYPRTRQEDGNLHVQILGVWEPENLSKVPRKEDTTESTAADIAENVVENVAVDIAESTTESKTAMTTIAPESPAVTDGYFSIRGEVIYHSKDDGQVVAKIRQSPRKQDEKPKFFKLKLLGGLPERGTNYFWDLHVQLQGNNLVIQQANNIGAMPVKKKFGKKPPMRGGGYQKFSGSPAPRPVIKGEAQRPEQSERTTPLAPPKRRELPIKPKPPESPSQD